MGTCGASLCRKLFGNRWIGVAGHFSESLISSRGPRLSLRANGQLLASNGATARENGLAVGGLHAGPKSVRLGAATVIRLKGSFRHFVPGNIDYTTAWGNGEFPSAYLQHHSELKASNRKQRAFLWTSRGYLPNHIGSKRASRPAINGIDGSHQPLFIDPPPHRRHNC
jgi:hypothetical protein